MRIVYNSFSGRYSDSPRAVFERLEGRRGIDHVWMVDPEHAHTFPSDLRTVGLDGPETRRALETADVLLASSHTELEWDKPAGSTYVQTWHGTPLKRVHRDVLWAPPGRLDRLDRDVARWDVLVSPNAESTPRLRSAFRYSGEVLEIGYPRNDLLHAPDRDLLRATTREALGIDEQTTAVLYAPTWRDDEKFVEGEPAVPLALDIPALVGALGDDHRLLVRTHPLMTGRSVPPGADHVVDVSYHPDVRDLYLAADVLVTDYSSVMFDFAITGKPMVFFAYDLERFRDEVRGFYFDLVEAVPGPLVTTTAQVAAALADLPSLQAAHAERYAAFADRFCRLEDGRASDRLVDRLRLPRG